MARVSAMKPLLRWALAHPLVRDRDPDDPGTAALRTRIVREKVFLRRIYERWYRDIAACLPPGPEPVLEIGAAGGFLQTRLHKRLGLDVLPAPGVDMLGDARELPVRDACLRALVLVNVLHHVPSPVQFFHEAARVLSPGGIMVMVEPWVTRWSCFVYSRLHHEPFAPHAPSWNLPAGGPLSMANGALPWILLKRDRKRFFAACPGWTIQEIKPMMPFCYLASGGIGLRALQPGWMFGFWNGLEKLLEPWMGRLAMFARIVLVRETN
jgi:SAM-dependent methyltransferase